MTKEDKEHFNNSTKCWVSDNDVKVRDSCHITEKYRASAHRSCNINPKLQISCRILNLKIMIIIKNKAHLAIK